MPNPHISQLSHHAKKLRAVATLLAKMMSQGNRIILRHRRAQVTVSTFVCVLISVLYLNALR